MTFTRSDLYSDISEADLVKLISRITGSGQPDPVDATIVAQTAIVTRYTSVYQLDDDQLKGFVRRLVVWDLYRIAGTIPDRVQKAYDATMKELADIRDGKFKNLPLAPAPNVPTAGKGGWGSGERISDSNFKRGTTVGS